MNDRLRGFFKGLSRLLFIGAALGALFLGWRALLHYGPGLQGGPPMFAFHAKALVRQRMAFPRPAPPVFLPEPRSMSSADVQLRLMKWWDGKTWLPEALAQGESVQGGLQLQAGELTLAGVDAVDASTAPDGGTICLVRVKVRWDFPQALQEPLRVREIVGLKLPKGSAPGQAAGMTCTFARTGWHWQLVSAESPWGGKLPVTGQRSNVLDWLF